MNQFWLICLDSQGGKYPYAEVAGAIESLGCKHVETDVSQVHTDEENKIVTTAAFMCETDFHEIHDGVAKMVEATLKLCWKSKKYDFRNN